MVSTFQKMADLAKRISDLMNEIEGYEVDLKNTTSSEEKCMLRRLITSCWDNWTELLKQQTELLKQQTELLKKQTEFNKGTWYCFIFCIWLIFCAGLFIDSVYLSKFLWKDVQPVADELFPENHFGQYVLKRDRVIKKVKEEMASRLAMGPGEATSVYLPGCRGSGKTCLQMLLARSLKADGYEVYFFKSAEGIPQGASLAFKSLLEDKTKKVAVLIDEVATNPESGLFIALLKRAYPHLVTIGSAVPRFIPAESSAMFKSVLRMTELFLKEDDEDFQELVEYCVGLKATTPELTQTICKYLLKQCGGHTFPTLAFIEYFFTRGGDAKRFLVSVEVFQRHFCGPDFARSPFYQSVRRRCFAELRDAETEKLAFRVLGGKEEAGDISTVTRLGWWDSEAGDFISRFLVNACLSGVQPRTDGVLYLDKKNTHEENTELVIVQGLSGMDVSDFKCWRHKSLSFNWAHKARVKVPNAYLHFQERAVASVVDFHLNGFADTAIEVMLDATQTADPKTTGQSHDIDAHHRRFCDDKYNNWKRYVLFNFAMSNDKIILPRDTSAHDKVYTFVRSTNTLYRGMKPLKTPAIPNLSGGSRPFGDGPTRSFSTVVKRFIMSSMRRW
jgi:hypothetical protein